jgi:hypothetical protein
MGLIGVRNSRFKDETIFIEVIHTIKLRPKSSNCGRSPAIWAFENLGSFLEFRFSDFGYSPSSRYLCRPKFKGS